MTTEDFLQRLESLPMRHDVRRARLRHEKSLIESQLDRTGWAWNRLVSLRLDVLTIELEQCS